MLPIKRATILCRLTTQQAATINSLINSFKRWYAKQEARNLAKLTPAERIDVLAFDSAFKRHIWRNTATYIGVWLLLALVFKLSLGRIGWVGSVLLAGLAQISLTLTLIGVWFGPSRFKVGMKSVLLLLAVTLTAAIVGGLGAKLILTDSMGTVLSEFAQIAPQLVVGGLVAGLAYAVLMVSIVQYRRGQLLRYNVELLRQTHRERKDRQLADAKLRLLQAQVEPHFLFNTLASVQQLAEGRADDAAKLTAQLITFLRAGLASLREETTTLQRECNAIEAYLAIMQTRMGERLQWRVELPAALRDISVPPAMLITLVENAIKHGLEPVPDGGRIDIDAYAENGRLRLRVADTGQGPEQSKVAGGGFGLDNIRERLRAIYAGDARLDIAANVPRGFVAVIDIPLPGNIEALHKRGAQTSEGKTK